MLIHESNLKNKGKKAIPFSEHGKIIDRGAWRIFKPVINYKECIRCHTCWLHCPDSAYQIDKKGYTKADPLVCKGCGVCASVCPVKCIKMVKDKHRVG